MESAKALGFRKGDFVHTGSYPGILIGDIHTRTPLCEVWGHEHGLSSAYYAEDLQMLSWPTFKEVAGRYGFDGTADSEAAKAAIKLAQLAESSREKTTA